jgi:aminocarboxymuconate-semialdehyde decarboxylase
VTEILDVWAHVLPGRYFERLDAIRAGPEPSPRIRGQLEWHHVFSALVDLDARRRAIEGIENYRQILVLGVPPLEELGDASLTTELARLANDEMAGLVRSHPDLFAGFAASLPLNDVEASLAELERAMGELGALGAQLYTPAVGRPLDDPIFEPLLAKLAGLGGAVWLHPTRGQATPDYETEPESRYGLWFALGWPIETTVALARFVFSGVVARYPELPFITHHGGGGLVHQFPERVVELAMLEMEGALSEESECRLVGQLQTFYADTVVNRDAGLLSSFDFFGVEHMLFATDMPFGAPAMVHDRIAQIHRLGLSDEDARAVFAGNARRVLRL